MKIGLDIMGGDYAPKATIQGAAMARSEFPDDVIIVLFGDQKIIKQELIAINENPEGFEIVHTTQKIEMGDHPVRAVSSKPDSSISKGFGMLATEELDAFCSAGNTGAMLAGAMFSIKPIPGLIRPAIAVAMPQVDGGYALLLDVGLNPDSRPDVLYQHGIMGSLYSHYVFQNESPKVALLNIGSEEDKGNLMTKSAYQMMKGSPDFNFTGNIEGNDIFFNKADVIVCDGFTGNVVLKQAESFYHLMKKFKNGNDFFEQFNYENFGGTPILGVGSPVLIGHGISSPLAIKNMLLQNKKIVESGVIRKIKKAFK